MLELATHTRPELTCRRLSPLRPGLRDRDGIGHHMASPESFVAASMYHLLPLYLADGIVVYSECLVVCGINLSPIHISTCRQSFNQLPPSSSSSALLTPPNHTSIQSPTLPTNDSPNAPSHSLTKYQLRSRYLQDKSRKTLTSGT